MLNPQTAAAPQFLGRNRQDNWQAWGVLLVICIFLGALIHSLVRQKTTDDDSKEE